MHFFGSLLFLFCLGPHSPVRSLHLSCPAALVSVIDGDAWLKGEARVSIPVILEHISPADAAPGAVIAAKTRNNPNYYYHWVRDAGLVLDSLVPAYGASSEATRQTLLTKFKDYVKFSAGLQNLPALTGLGEPKFLVTGQLFNDPWGRPQKDSPALRVISMVDWSKALALTDRDWIKASLLPVVRADLGYIAKEWPKPGFDLWEEVFGDHLYTRLVQRRALLEGAQFLSMFGENELARTYQAEGNKIGKDLLAQFWNEPKGYFEATKNARAGAVLKPRGLDTAVILGVLHGSTDDNFLPANDPRVQKTAAKLIATFRDLYPINHHDRSTGAAIGRYPEDDYSGADRHGGNPWPLCTLALAELQYRAAALESRAGHPAHARELTHEADLLVARVQALANPDGSLSEQMDRNTGLMTSVSELTWNYAAILTTASARATALNP